MHLFNARNATETFVMSFLKVLSLYVKILMSDTSEIYILVTSHRPTALPGWAPVAVPCKVPQVMHYQSPSDRWRNYTLAAPLAEHALRPFSSEIHLSKLSARHVNGLIFTPPVDTISAACSLLLRTSAGTSFCSTDARPDSFSMGFDIIQ